MKITRQQIRKIIQEALNESPRRFGDYSKKDSNSYRTVITMSPEGDSAIVDGIETYIDDVPQQLEILSGFSMEGNDPDNLIFALEEMMQDGYVELAVSYENGQWGW